MTGWDNTSPNTHILLVEIASARCCMRRSSQLSPTRAYNDWLDSFKFTTIWATIVGQVDLKLLLAAQDVVVLEVGHEGEQGDSRRVTVQWF
jgi:hypothetical protein